MSAYTYSTPTKADGGHEFTIYKHGQPVTGAWVRGSKRGATQEAKRMVERLQREHDAAMQAFYGRTWREMFGEAR